MKQSLLTLSILFLISGDSLFSHIDHIHEHDDSIEYHECEECFSLENNNIYTIDFNDFTSLNHADDISAFQYLNFITFDIDSKNNSRAPPISK